MDRYIAIKKSDIKKFGSTYKFLNTINKSKIYIYQLTKFKDLRNYTNWDNFKNDYNAFYLKTNEGFRILQELEKIQDYFIIKSIEE